MTKRIVVKALDFTEVITRTKGSHMETVQHWRLQTQRKPEDCGVWEDGEKIKSFEDMRP